MKIRISRNKASLSSKINLFSCCIRVEKRDRALDILSGGKNRAISFNHFVNSSLISTSPYDSLQEWRTRSFLTSFLGSALDRQLLSNRRIAWKKAQKKKMKSSVRHGDRAWVSFSTSEPFPPPTRERSFRRPGHQHATVTIATTHHAN